MKEYKVIIFDLDGTISDSGVGITKCVQYALKKLNIIEEDLELLPKGYYIRKSEKAESKYIKYCAAYWQNNKNLMPYVDSISSAKQCSNWHNFTMLTIFLCLVIR